MPEEPEFDPELPDFELPENIGELVEFVVVFEVLMVFWVFFELMLIPDASNLVATQLNSLVCKQAKVIITGKSEMKNKVKVSLDINKCNSGKELQKLHHIFDLNLLLVLAQKQRLLTKRRKNSWKYNIIYVDILAHFNLTIFFF